MKNDSWKVVKVDVNIGARFRNHSYSSLTLRWKPNMPYWFYWWKIQGWNGGGWITWWQLKSWRIQFVVLGQSYRCLRGWISAQQPGRCFPWRERTARIEKFQASWSQMGNVSNTIKTYVFDRVPPFGSSSVWAELDAPMLPLCITCSAFTIKLACYVPGLTLLFFSIETFIRLLWYYEFYLPDGSNVTFCLNPREKEGSRAPQRLARVSSLELAAGLRCCPGHFLGRCCRQSLSWVLTLDVWCICIAKMIPGCLISN